MTAAPEVTAPIRALARTRSPGGLTRNSSATAVGTVAAAPAWDRVRAAMRLVAFHASGVPRANTMAVTIPARYTRRCPNRSPSRPNSGVHTAAASSGAVVTQTTVEGREPRSSAIGWTAIVRIVEGNAVVNSPSSRAG